MKFTSLVKVTGMKFNKGTMDNGQSFDSTKVFVEMPLDSTRDNAMGAATTEYALGKAEEYQKYTHLASSFPFMANADMEIVTNGKTQKTVIHSLTPVDATKSGKSGFAKNEAA